MCLLELPVFVEKLEKNIRTVWSLAKKLVESETYRNKSLFGRIYVKLKLCRSGQYNFKKLDLIMNFVDLIFTVYGL